MWALNIKIRDNQGQMELVNDLYKDSLDIVLNSDINDTMVSIINTNPYSLRQTTSATQQKTAFGVSMPSKFFNKVGNGRDKTLALL